MTVRDLIIFLLQQDPDEIISIAGCENFYIQLDGPYLIFDEKMLDGCKAIATNRTKPREDQIAEAFKMLIAFYGYTEVLAMVVQNELGGTYKEALKLTIDWREEDDNFTEFISQFFYKEDE